MKIYEVDKRYINILYQVDQNVMKEKTGANPRKYIGVVLKINNFNYFAPLSSPKHKHKTMRNDKDFLKINGGKHGVINFNNMIPVPDNYLIDLDIEKISNIKYKSLLNKQAIFVRKNKNKITKIAKNLYLIMTTDIDPSNKKRIKPRCCNFKKLELKANNYT